MDELRKAGLEANMARGRANEALFNGDKKALSEALEDARKWDAEIERLRRDAK